MPVQTRRQFAQQLTDGCVAFVEPLCGVKLYSYQIEIVDRILFSLIYGDGEEITILCSRQAGKSESIACTAAVAMVLLPRLACLFPRDKVLQKFKDGVMIGVFGPIDEQSETIFSRISLRMSSAEAEAALADPEIDDTFISGTQLHRMKRNKSFCRKQTAHHTAKIESKTYHLIFIDEAQDANSEKVRKSIHPMATATNGTICKIGTPTSHKSDFHEAINRNKHRPPTHGKKNHFEFNYKRAAKENPFYRQSVKKEMERLGEDSDEVRMAYKLEWMFDRGMFITQEEIDELGDETMQIISYWNESPIVVGIDVAEKHDSTVVTAIWVDWEHPNEFGLFDHRVLDWLELHGEHWESQYQQMCEFVSRYQVLRIGVDAQGMGSPVAARLATLLPHIEVIPLPMNGPDQAKRWQHLTQLIQRKLIGWPAHPRVKRLKKFKRFTQQLSDVEKDYVGKNLRIGTPKGEKNMHDDYVDSLALGCWLTKEFATDDYVEEWNYNPFTERNYARRG